MGNGPGSEKAALGIEGWSFRCHGSSDLMPYQAGQ